MAAWLFKQTLGDSVSKPLMIDLSLCNYLSNEQDLRLCPELPLFEKFRISDKWMVPVLQDSDWSGLHLSL